MGRHLMPDQPKETVARDANTGQKRSNGVVPAIEKAKAKNARLRLLKERNENYLAEREVDEDFTKELRVTE
jgi:hypothetical protein